MGNRGINWSDISKLSNAGVNWTDVSVLEYRSELDERGVIE